MASPVPRRSSSASKTSMNPPPSSISRLPPQPERLFSSPSNNSEYFLKLSDKVVHFEPVAKGTSVFFDDIQCQIFVVRENSITSQSNNHSNNYSNNSNNYSNNYSNNHSISQQLMGHTATVSVRSPILSRNMDFFIADKGSVLSIKFSPDLLILAVQRSNKSVEFLNVEEGRTNVDLIEYSQTCRARSAKILGFCWVSSTEIVLVTDTQGLESYQIRAEKKILKSLKNFSLGVNWFLYTPPYLLLASGVNCNVFHLFLLKSGGNYQRFPKFEVEPNAVQGSQTAKLMERDVMLAPVYGSLYLFIVKQVSKLNAGAEIVLHHITREGLVKITDVLLLECNGRFAINILDNLVVVHHQQSRMSKIFDLRLNTRMDGIRYHYPISSFSIEPFEIKMSGHSVPYELYSSNWAVFLPSIIVDAKLGCLWQLDLQIDSLAGLIPDRLKRVEFLLFREADAKVVLLRHLTDYLHEATDYLTVVKCFDLLNAKLKKVPTDDGAKRTVFLDESEVFRYLLLPLSNAKQLQPRYIVGVLVDYLKSLIAHHLEPQYYIHELIVNSLVQFKMFHMLRLLVENGVFFDSKPFACLLLSLDNVFPPAFQMALDMLKRVGNSSEERAEVLLAQYQIIPAIRLLMTTGGLTEAQLAPRKFLEPALQSGDHVLFYSVFRFFQQRNVRLRSSPAFLPEELCDDIVYQFDCLFPELPQPRGELVF